MGITEDTLRLLTSALEANSVDRVRDAVFDTAISLGWAGLVWWTIDRKARCAVPVRSSGDAHEPLPLTDPRFGKEPPEAADADGVAFRIQSRGRLAELLEVDSTGEAPLPPWFVGQFTDTLSAHLERLQNADRQREVSANASAATEVLAAVNSATEESQAITAALRTTCEAFNWQLGVYWALQGDSFELSECLGTDAATASALERMSASPSKALQRTARTRRPVAATELSTDDTLGGVGFTSAVHVPLQGQEPATDGGQPQLVIRGVFSFYSRDRTVVSTGRLRSFRTITQLVGSALARLREEHQLRELALDAAAVNQVLGNLAGCRSVQAAKETAVTETCAAFDWAAGSYVERNADGTLSSYAYPNEDPRLSSPPAEPDGLTPQTDEHQPAIVRVPVYAEKRLLGWLAFDRRVGVALSESRQTALSSLARLLATTIVRLEDATRSRQLSKTVEVARASMMIVDQDGVITYGNASLIQLLAEQEALLVDWVLEPADIVGKSLHDVFSAPLDGIDLTRSGRGTVTAGEQALEAAINPIHDAQGERVGSAIEWWDVGAQRRYNAQIDRVIGAVSEGHLTVRAETTGIPAGLQTSLEALNRAIDAIASPIGSVVQRLQSLASGRPTDRLSAHQRGEVGALVCGLNALIDATSKVVSIAEQIASGDLCVDITLRSEDDALMSALQRMVADLHDAIATSRGAAQQVSASSTEVSESGVVVSDATRTAAASLQEVSATMVQLGSQTRQNAANASEASELTKEATEIASIGNTRVETLVRSMREVSDASGRIAEIIQVIDEIAFQTNMLALNAAVESARAGVHGRSFAVVAEEVRTLASRCANAAKRTAELINDTSTKVENGSQAASAAADAFSNIDSVVQKTATLAYEIAQASSEQSSGIEQVNASLRQLEDTMANTAASAQRSTDIAAVLSDKSGELLDRLHGFQLRSHALSGGMNDASIGHLTPELIAQLQSLLEASGHLPRAAASNDHWSPSEPLR